MLPSPLGPTAAWWGWGVRPTWELIAILGEPWGVRGDHRQTKKPEQGRIGDRRPFQVWAVTSSTADGHPSPPSFPHQMQQGWAPHTWCRKK